MSRIPLSPAHFRKAATGNPLRQLLVQVGLFTLLTVPALATEDATADPLEGVENAAFEYVLENRRDPFMPFITEKAAAASVDMNEIVDKQEPLTGMQLFEPGQLTLVAVLKAGAQDYAMVQDTTGKGYTLHPGTKIGRRGVVKNITPVAVIIEETAVTRAGNTIVTEIVMALKKEGE
jgi:Tfp pilus assembly protein PilP